MEWTRIVLLALAGAGLGVLVGLFNRWLISSLMRDFDEYPLSVAKRKLLVRYILRYLLNVVTLLATYKWVPALLGAALGLLIVQKAYVIQHTFLRKGVKK